ncbi:histone acetyltransferase [Fusarium heterosporum]|uniref:Histone acetyltransferase n=1 Tax=Fusarium heterosporum TaxID=42747 RepID=A0A8H5TXV4_FUSHE|nr:histone acetyltransferase [Fusarium heterosporum]
MEEELQHSVMVSDEDAEYETAGETGGDATIVASGPRGANSKMSTEQVTTDNGDAEFSDRDASGEDVDASGEEDNDYMSHQQISSHNSRQATQDEEEDDEDDEDEAEDEEEAAEAEEGEEEGNDMDAEGDEDVDAEGEEYDDDEGVGAVKIQPGIRDDDDEDSESDRSESPSANDEESDEEAAWENAAEAEEDHDDEATATSNNCIFCDQSEEDDPSEEFEAYLACARCGGNGKVPHQNNLLLWRLTDAAHQQCARDAAAMSTDNTPNAWKCPECFNRESDAESESGSEDEEMEDHGVDHDIELPSQQSDIPELSGEHQSKQQVDDEDASSQDDNDELDELDEEPREAPRTLRKRKSSSLEDDGNATSLRKRRRNQSNDAGSEGTARTGSAEPGRHQPSRTLRLKVTRPPPVAVEKHTRTSLVLRLQVKPGNLKEILSRKRREKRRQPATVTQPAPPRPAPPSRATLAAISALPTPFTTDNYSQPYYTLYERDADEMKGKPYGGILTEAEADTAKTCPTPEDKDKFNAAKQKAEDEWRARLLALQEEANVPNRRTKKGSDIASQIECIEFGGWEIDTWYAAPYPAEYTRNRVLFICEFCLKYMNSDYVAWRHKLKCPAKHPPGDEIYRHGSVSVFEVDGRKNPVYCQNLCLLAKLFLGSKTLYYDVEPFLFYVLCEYNETGYHFVGYFSKEKRASSQNNVSCILTLPIHQRKGYGNLLIDFSYLLTKVEEKTGSPEKPLSDMGLVSYRNYWRLVLCRYFLNVMENEKFATDGLSVKKISAETGMTADDVVSALEGLRALVRDPQTKVYAFRVDSEYCRQYVGKWEAKGYVQLKPEALVWTPYVMGRSNTINFELGPPINTIAPREDDEAKVDEGQGMVGAEDQPMVDAVVNGEGHTALAPNTEAEATAEAEADIDAAISNGVDAGANPSIQMTTNGDGQLDSAVLNGNAEHAPVQSIEDATHGQGQDKDVEMGDAEVDGPPAWLQPYQNIPYTRFEVFPAVPGGRRDRTRTSVSRPTAPRTASSTSRPKRPSSNRRTSSSRPRSSSKKKSGGTGRGPGRWPKGTKKSDYGNAASGPGLPPGWNDKHSVLQAVTEGNDPEQEVAVEEPAEDSVVVSTRINGTKVNGNGALHDASGTASNGEQAIEDEEDVDAEGEDI